MPEHPFDFVPLSVATWTWFLKKILIPSKTVVVFLQENGLTVEAYAVALAA
jgi:hypothetical protein